MRFTVTDTSAQFVEAMAKRSTNITFASAVALTRTAQKVKTAQTDLMAQKLDRPTRFTLNSLMLKPATKTKLEAIVQTKEGFGSVPAGRFLLPLVEGGQRRMKASEKRLDSYWTPARGIPLDASGNVRGSTINKILSQLKLRNDTAQNASKSKRSKAKRASESYFISDGIVFQRKGKTSPSPYLILVKKVPTYRKMLPWYETATEVIDQTLPAEFYKALDQFRD
jgi:hypothetical protein